MTVTLCPVVRENALASSITPGVAPWLVTMMSSADRAAPCRDEAKSPRMHAAAKFRCRATASSALSSHIRSQPKQAYALSLRRTRAAHYCLSSVYGGDQFSAAL